MDMVTDYELQRFREAIVKLTESLDTFSESLKESKYGYYQKCPVCDGQGHVMNVSKDSSLNFGVCDTCRGSRILSRPKEIDSE